MKKMLVLFTVMLAVTVSLVLTACAAEIPPVVVTLNGEKVDCAAYGQEATIVEDRTLVPLRAIFEALGADIVWDEPTRTVISARGNDVIELTIGSNVLLKNKQSVEVDVPARIMSDRTMVPVRVIAESFGVLVEWDNSTRTVILECKKETIPERVDISSELDEKQIYGEFFFGMTMQQAWDAVGADEGEKSVAVADGMTQILVADGEGTYKNEDEKITGSANCSLIKLSFAWNHLCEVSVYSDYLQLEEAVKVRDSVASFFGEPGEKRKIGNEGNERDTEYVWTAGQQEVVCRIERMSSASKDGGSKIGNVCILNVKDKAAKELFFGVDEKNSKDESDDKADSEVKEDKDSNKNKDKDTDKNKDNNKDKNDDKDNDKDIDTDKDNNKENKDEENREDDEETPDDEGDDWQEDVNSLALEALEKYLDACTSFDFSKIFDLTTNSYGVEKLGIESLGDALSYAGVTNELLSKIMLEKTYKGNEAYRPLTDAVIEVVLDFTEDASELLFYTASGVSSNNSDEVVFNVTHYAPDISAMEEVFAESFDKAVKKAFADGTVSFSMTQEEMMVPLSKISADELRAAFDTLLDKDSFVPSATEKVTVVKSRNGKWLVELDKSDSEFIKTVKNGGNKILELFGFDVK